MKHLGSKITLIILVLFSGLHWNDLRALKRSKSTTNIKRKSTTTTTDAPTVDLPQAPSTPPPAPPRGSEAPPLFPTRGDSQRPELMNLQEQAELLKRDIEQGHATDTRGTQYQDYQRNVRDYERSLDDPEKQKTFRKEYEDRLRETDDPAPEKKSKARYIESIPVPGINRAGKPIRMYEEWRDKQPVKGKTWYKQRAYRKLDKPFKKEGKELWKAGLTPAQRKEYKKMHREKQVRKGIAYTATAGIAGGTIAGVAGLTTGGAGGLTAGQLLFGEEGEAEEVDPSLLTPLALEEPGQTTEEQVPQELEEVDISGLLTPEGSEGETFEEFTLTEDALL